MGTQFPQAASAERCVLGAGQDSREMGALPSGDLQLVLETNVNSEASQTSLSGGVWKGVSLGSWCYLDWTICVSPEILPETE